ncbi:MAG: amidohydrolase family protein [Bacillales bacterium]|nr:amidohydrolase family protein [Bacillales bacterium]
MNEFVKIRRDLHQIPEMAFEEFKTQAYLLDYLSKLPQDRIQIETWRTGIFLLVKGMNPTKTIGYRADMDGLPIEELHESTFKSQNMGRMHACGHDFHMSIALGVLTYFIQEIPIEDNLLFMFQPAEESVGGAELMIQTEIFAKCKPDFILALHIAPEYPVGTVATRPGVLFANTYELFIEFEGLGGHAAYPHKANDMVVAASNFVTQIQTIVSRSTNPIDSAVVTIGRFDAGTTTNIIAEKARLEGTIRTLSVEAMEAAKSRIFAIARGIEESFDCKISFTPGSAYYQVNNHKELTEEFMSYVDGLPDFQLVEAEKAMTGEDFGFMIGDVPGFMFWLGVDSEYGLHHAKLNPNEVAIEKAIKLVTAYISNKSKK